MVAWDEKMEEGITKSSQETFGGDGHVHSLDYGDSFVGIHICESFQTVYFKCEHYIVCQLYISKAKKN